MVLEKASVWIFKSGFLKKKVMMIVSVSLFSLETVSLTESVS